MKKINIFALLLSGAVLCGSLTACNDDEPQGTPEDPTVEVTKQRPTSLAFSWHAIEGINQYGYELTNPEGDIVDTGVLQGTSIEFNDLQPSTTYTLTVWAYTPVPGNTPSGKTVIEQTTGSQIILGAPQNLTASLNSATGNIDVTFSEVTDATYYHYELAGATQLSGDWTETSASFSNLATGEYALSVWADNEDPDYARSAAAIVRFSVDRIQLAAVTGLTISQDLDYSAETYIDFNAVANADKYLYTITGTEDKSGEFTEVMNNILLLPGNYSISLVAASNDPLYANSPAVTQDFTVSAIPLAQPDASTFSFTYTNGTLTIKWAAVKGATSYGYVLYDPDFNELVPYDDNVSTNTNSLTYTGQLTAGNYCLAICSYSTDPYTESDTDWTYYYFDIN